MLKCHGFLLSLTEVNGRLLLNYRVLKVSDQDGLACGPKNWDTTIVAMVKIAEEALLLSRDRDPRQVLS